MADGHALMAMASLGPAEKIFQSADLLQIVVIFYQIRLVELRSTGADTT